MCENDALFDAVRAGDSRKALEQKHGSYKDNAASSTQNVASTPARSDYDKSPFQNVR